jgi:acyl-CoA dehydrogenase
MRRVVNDAMDVQGGSAISLGPRNLLGRVYQSIPIGITVEGANILTRSLIIFGQGAVRCHPYVLKEIRAVADPDRAAGLINFDRAFFGHCGFTISTAARALWLGISGGRLLATPGGPARRLLQITSRLSTAFVLAADLSMIIIGSGLKRREKLSGRLADILSQLYLVSASIKQFEDHGRPADELPLLEWACASSFCAIQLAFEGFIANFPNRPAALLLRLLSFPLGIPGPAPGDRLGQRVAAILLAPSAVRDRLTAGIYTPTVLSEPLGRLDDALAKVIAAEAVEKKLRDAVKAQQIAAGSDEQMLQEGVQAGVITDGEAGIVTVAQAARQEVIRVDDFPADYWRTGGGHE